MNRRDLQKFRNVDEFWDKKFKEEFDLFYSDDSVEDLKNK